jgi:hypothetical protein
LTTKSFRISRVFILRIGSTSCTPFSAVRSVRQQSVVAKLLFPPDKNETNPAFSKTKIADKVLVSLYAVLYTENDKVLSYHKSFTDFMFNQHRAKEFWCDQAKHHRLLADCCFRVMAHGLKFNIANIIEHHSYLIVIILHFQMQSSRTSLLS